MRYHYEKPTIYLSMYGKRYICDHPVYDSCTLFEIGDKGLAVIQQRYDAETKSTFWTEVDAWLTDALYVHPKFKEFFDKRAGTCTDGLWPTVTIRQIMWALKMKPLTKKPTPPSKLESTKKAVDATSELVNRAKKMDQDSRNATKKERMDLSKKTDKELRDQINRELLERQYNDLFAKESVSKGRRYLSDVLDNAGTVLAVGSSALSIALAIQQLQKKAG